MQMCADKWTQIHNVLHADMNDWEFKAAYMTSYHGLFQVKISQLIDICLIFLSESLLYEFLNFLQEAKGPVLVSLQLQYDYCKQIEEWKLDFARKCSIKHGENAPSATIGPLLWNAKDDSWLFKPSS